MGPIRVEVGGIKCDAAGCGWSDMTVKRKDYPRWRNASCPSCGANVLSDADWKAMRIWEFAVGTVNLLLFWKKPPLPTEPHAITRVVLTAAAGQAWR